MSGRRRRALKAVFLKKHGRLPYKASFRGYAQKGYGPVWDPQDELRRAKKDHVRGLSR